ncbi:MAG: pentapeptide repeat-containing protein [Pseudomonadota bacterium]
MLAILVGAMALGSAPFVAPLPQERPDARAQAEQIRDECMLGADVQILDVSKEASRDDVLERVRQAEHKRLILHGAALKDGDITDVLKHLEGGCIHDSDLSGTKATNAAFSNSTIVRSTLEGADWSGATLNGTVFKGVDAKKANLKGAQLRRGRWIGAFRKSQLFEVDLSDADLTGFVFECGASYEKNCRGTGRGKFDRANFTDADLSEYSFLAYRSLEGARFDNTRIYPYSITWLDGIRVEGPLILASSAAWRGEPGVEISPREFRRLYKERQAVKNDAPSFDCKKAQGFAEENICWEFGAPLRKSDREVAAMLKLAKKRGLKDIEVEHKQWLSQRNACDGTPCLYESYRVRIAQLMAQLNSRLELEPGGKRVFHLDVLPVRDRTRKSRLYQKILPTLRQASNQVVTLTGLPSGGVQINGSALSQDADVCTVDAMTQYDAATGWYVTETRQGERIQIFRVWGGKLHLRYSGNNRSTPMIARDFVHCPGEGLFGRLRDLDGED